MAARKSSRTKSQPGIKSVKSKKRGAKKAPSRAKSPEDQLLAQLSRDTEKLLEDFIQKQYAALSDFASDIVVSTAKRLLQNHKWN
jgi:hypothetical protein